MVQWVLILILLKNSMKLLEDQVCSLEFSKKLEELGVKQNSIFWWRKYSMWKKPDLMYIPNKNNDILILSGKLEYSISAFTVAELGEMLPNWASSYRLGKLASKNCGKYCCEYHIISKKHTKDFEFISDTEADCRAKMLIYLIENKLIKL